MTTALRSARPNSTLAGFRGARGSLVVLALTLAASAGCASAAGEGASETLAPPSDVPPASPGADGSNVPSGGARNGEEEELGAKAEERNAPTGVPIVRAIERVTVETLAGSATPGAAEGTGGAAQFDNPVGVFVEPAGGLLVTEYDGERLRRVSAAGTTSTLVTGLRHPFGLVRTSSAIYVQTDSDSTGIKTTSSGTIWKVGLDGSNPRVVVTGLGRPRGLVALADGRLVVSDRLRRVVMLLDPTTNATSLLAGSGAPGRRDGRGAAAEFGDPYGATALPDGSIVVADRENHVLRRIALDGEVTTFAGDGSRGMKDDPDRSRARFDSPSDLAADRHGNVFVSDVGNHRIRRISPAGDVETVAGDGRAGCLDGEGKMARFFGQEQIDVTPQGDVIYVADGTGGEDEPYHRLRRITLPR